MAKTLIVLLFVVCVYAQYYTGTIPELHYRASYFSDLAYSDTSGIPLLSFPGWSRLDTIQVRTSFVNVYVDIQNRVLVLAFRGTEKGSWADVKLNFNIFVQNFNHLGDVHRGFATEYLEVKQNILYWLSQTQYSGYQLIVTGHSQGGAVAFIAAFDIKKTVGIQPILITFGAPRSLSQSSTMPYNSEVTSNIRYVTSFKNGNEIEVVPTLPPEDFGFLHAGEERRVECVTSSPIFISLACHSSYTDSIARHREKANIGTRPFRMIMPASGQLFSAGDDIYMQWDGALCTSPTCTVAVFYGTSYAISFQVGQSNLVFSTANTASITIPSTAAESKNYYVCVNPGFTTCSFFSPNFEVKGLKIPIRIMTPTGWYSGSQGRLAIYGAMPSTKTFALYRNVLLGSDVEITRWSVPANSKSTSISVPYTTVGCNYFICIQPNALYCEFQTSDFCLFGPLSPLNITIPARISRGNLLFMGLNRRVAEIDSYLITHSLIQNNVSKYVWNEYFTTTSMNVSITSDYELGCGYQVCVGYSGSACIVTSRDICIESQITSVTFANPLANSNLVTGSVLQVQWNEALPADANLHLVKANANMLTWKVTKSSTSFALLVSHTLDEACDYRLCFDRATTGCSPSSSSNAFCISKFRFPSPSTALFTQSATMAQVTLGIRMAEAFHLRHHILFDQWIGCNAPNANLLNTTMLQSTQRDSGNVTYSLAFPLSNLFNSTNAVLFSIPSQSDLFSLQVPIYAIYTWGNNVTNEGCMFQSAVHLMNIDMYYTFTITALPLGNVRLVQTRSYIDPSGSKLVSLFSVLNQNISISNIVPSLLQTSAEYTVELVGTNAIKLTSIKSASSSGNALIQMSVQQNNQQVAYQFNISFAAVPLVQQPSNVKMSLHEKQTPYKYGELFTPNQEVIVRLASSTFKPDIQTAHLCCFNGANTIMPSSCRTQTSTMNLWKNLVSNFQNTAAQSFAYAFEDHIRAISFSVASVGVSQAQDAQRATCFVSVALQVKNDTKGAQSIVEANALIQFSVANNSNNGVVNAAALVKQHSFVMLFAMLVAAFLFL